MPKALCLLLWISTLLRIYMLLPLGAGLLVGAAQVRGHLAVLASVEPLDREGGGGDWEQLHASRGLERHFTGNHLLYGGRIVLWHLSCQSRRCTRTCGSVAV